MSKGSIKLFILQLFEATLSGDASLSIDSGSTRIDITGRDVWLQGLVVGYQEDGGQLLLDDGSSCIAVDVSQCHGQDFASMIAEYVMVSGSPLVLPNRRIYLVAKNIVLLPESNLETLWIGGEVISGLEKEENSEHVATYAE